MRAALTGGRARDLPDGGGGGRLALAVGEAAARSLGEERRWVCEAAVRLTLSYVMVPAVSDEAACAQVARLVRGLTGP